MGNKGRNRGSQREDCVDEDIDHFRRHVADVTQYQYDGIVPPPTRAKPKARFRRRDERDALGETLEEDPESLEFGSGQSLAFVHPSVGRHTFRKLARGGFSIQSEIDLHGMTVAEARTALARFIEQSIVDGCRCVRVVHGKGRGSGRRGPILKRKVDTWLRKWRTVLAFVSARQVDGGTGAVYVLLRKG